MRCVDRSGSRHRRAAACSLLPWVNVPVARNVLFSRFISAKFTCLKFESPKQSADGLRIAGSFRKMSRMQFTAHRKRCGIHRITSILYRKTGTYVGGFSAILGLLWRIFRHSANFLLFLIAVRNVCLFWMVGFILHWASSSFGKLCMSHPSFFCIDIAASYLKNSFLSRQSPCILYDRKRTLDGVKYTIKVSFLV